MNAEEVRGRWPLGARFVSARDSTRRVRVVQAHVSPMVDGPDLLMLAHDRRLYWPSECSPPPALDLLVPPAPPPPAPPAPVEERIEQALAAAQPGNWERLQRRIAEEAEAERQRELQTALERRERAERERQLQMQRRQQEERERRQRSQPIPSPPLPPPPPSQERRPDLRLEAKVAELQRLLNAAHEALAQLQEQIRPVREMPTESGKQIEEERRLILDGEEDG